SPARPTPEGIRGIARSRPRTVRARGPLPLPDEERGNDLRTTGCCPNRPALLACPGASGPATAATRIANGQGHRLLRREAACHSGPRPAGEVGGNGGTFRR